jgi:tetratricopeptide (TPR) repeat protein
MPVLDWLRRRFGSPPREDGLEVRSAPASEGASEGAGDSFAEGERALREGRHADAIAAFEAALDREPSAALRLRLAQAHAAGGDEEAAIDELQLALHLYPEDVELRVSLAERLLGAGRRVQARELCEPGLDRAADLTLRLRYANCLMKLGRLPQAIEQYEMALEARPGDAAVLSTLGLAQASNGDFAAAEASYAQALRLDPNCVEGLHNLAMLRREQGAVDAARKLFERALALRPGSVETESALAHALRDLGRLDEALAQYRKVLARRPQPVDALLNYSYALLMNGQLAEGWDAYERRLSFAEPPVEVPPRAEWWTGEPGVAVHVVGEQGLGDQLMFASCLPDLVRTASQVSLSCAPRLEPLFRRSFAGVELRAPQSGPPRGARWVPLGSLPRYFRRQAGDFPAAGGYLQADPGRIAGWRERLAGLGPGPRIGLSWRGGTLSTRGHLRSIPVAALAALERVTPASWISLQYGRAEEDVARLAHTLPLHHWPEVASDLDECAALIRALDVVVAIDTTVAHLAGALGQRVWILLGQAPEWRYGLAGETMPWYPSARLFRQPAAGDWAALLESVRAALARELA